MQLLYFKEAALDLLKKSDLSANIKLYSENEPWIEKKYYNKKLLLPFNKVEVNDFKLKTENGVKDDFENMVIMYDNLKFLTDSQASDERLWAGLCHTKFWDYMQKRWPLPNNESDYEKYILQHYFFNHGVRSTLLNGVSRLWWYARLTYDETNMVNPYELTEYMARDINGKAYMLFGSNFSRNRNLQRIFLYTIKHYEEDHGIVLSRNEFNDLRKSIVLWSGKLVIDVVDPEIIKNKLINEINKLVTKR